MYPKNGGRVYIAKTKPDGSYEFERVQNAAVYHLSIHSTRCVGLSDYQDDNLNIPLDPPKTVTRNFALKPACQLQLTVVDESDHPALDCRALYDQWRANERELHLIVALADRAAHETEINRLVAVRKEIEQRFGFKPMLIWHLLGWAGIEESTPDFEAMLKTPRSALNGQTVLQAFRLPDGYSRVQRTFLGDWEPLPPPPPGCIS